MNVYFWLLVARSRMRWCGAQITLSSVLDMRLCTDGWICINLLRPCFEENSSPVFLLYLLTMRWNLKSRASPRLATVSFCDATRAKRWQIKERILNLISAPFSTLSCQLSFSWSHLEQSQVARKPNLCLRINALQLAAIASQSKAIIYRFHQKISNFRLSGKRKRGEKEVINGTKSASPPKLLRLLTFLMIYVAEPPIWNLYRTCASALWYRELQLIQPRCPVTDWKAKPRACAY